MSEIDEGYSVNDFFDIDEPQTFDQALKEIQDAKDVVKRLERNLKVDWKQELREAKLNRIINDDE